MPKNKTRKYAMQVNGAKARLQNASYGNGGYLPRNVELVEQKKGKERQD
jgi:hypothetical protein